MWADGFSAACLKCGQLLSQWNLSPPSYVTIVVLGMLVVIGVAVVLGVVDSGVASGVRCISWVLKS